MEEEEEEVAAVQWGDEKTMISEQLDANHTSAVIPRAPKAHFLMWKRHWLLHIWK